MTTDVERIVAKLNNFAINVTKGVDDTVFVTANMVRTDSIKAIRKPSKGKQYGKHTASAEGDAPNTDTGRLIGSIRIDHRKGSGVAFVGTDLDYGAFLELIHNRPWLEPSLKMNMLDFDKNLERVLDAQIKKAGK